MKTKSLDDKWIASVEAGKSEGRDKKLDRSLNEFRTAYDLSRKFDLSDPRRGESAYYLAYATYVQQDMKKAVELFREALRYMEEDVAQQQRCGQLHSILGAIFFGLSNFEDAEKHIKKAMVIEKEQNQKSWENLQLLASILVMQKKYDESVGVLERLIAYLESENSPELLKTIHILAYVHNQLGNKEEEIRWQKESLRVREDQSTEHLDSYETDSYVPENWGLDRISHFLEATRHNHFASFYNYKDKYEKLVDIDAKFWGSRRNLTLHMANLIDAKDIDEFSSIIFESAELLELYFFLRAHSSFLGTIQLALSGQCPEAFMVMRGCLENAQYAWYIHNKPNLKEVWLNRDNGDDERKEVRKQFTAEKIKKLLDSAEPELSAKVSALYDKTIDEGAHPNANVFFSNALQKNDEGEIRFSVTYLNPKEGIDAISKTIDTGKVVLELFSKIFPDLIERY